MQTLEEWALENGITLLDVDNNPNLRVFYISEGVECLQVVIENKGGDQRVDVWSVETAGDEELHYSYHFPVSELTQRLDEILGKIRCWFQDHSKLHFKLNR